jgi:hypothetical protein
MLNWKKLFDNKYVLWFIQYYNLIVLILYVLGCYVFLFDYTFYKVIYQILIAILGFNISSQIFIGYLLSRLKFCQWQSIAFLFNVIINLTAFTLKILALYFLIPYDIIIMTVMSSVFLTYIIIYLITRKNKNKK